MIVSGSGRSRVVGALISCSLLGSLTGCGGPTTAEIVSDSVAVTTVAPSAPNAAVVYFMNRDGTGLMRVTRTGPDTPARVRAALSALAAAAPPVGGIRALPAGTEIVSVSLQGDEARVELNEAFVRGYPSGGAAAEAAVIAPLVFTATEIPGVRRVLFTVSGDTPSLQGSQYDWGRPFSRADFPDLAVADA